MQDTNSETTRIINNIINLEWEMFKSVKASEPNPCQENENTFRLMRWMGYSVMPEELLKEILNNVNQATLDDRNLMTEKYARMADQIPVINNDPLIDECVQIEKEMMVEVKKEFPLTFSGQNSGFENYMRSELETYSESAIKLYYTFLINVKMGGRNVIKARYDNLFRKLGYESLADKESKERQKEFWSKNECKGC